MGMFLSKYSMLSALGYGDDSYVLPETIKILDKYKLFGLIIHDPNVHSEFNNKLSQIFERLDYLTGPDFLFFCLIDPPLKWKKRVDRDYFGIWEPEKLLDPNNAYSTTDESISAYSLAQSLGISFDDLPVIILTNDFRLNEYRFIKTSEAFLEDQLKEIGMFSSQKQKHFDLKNDSELNNLIKSIDFCGRTELMKMEYSLAKNLSDYISFVIADTSAHDSKKANKQSRIVIRNFLSNTNKIIDSNEIDSLNIGFLGKLANINMRHFYSEHMLFENANVKEERAEYSIISKPIDSDIVIPNLESESRALYRIYKKVMPIFSQLLIEDSTEEFEDIDYTPLVICLSKIFEIEINLSVVTWIRKYLNI